MEVNKEIFEQISYGKTCDTMDTPYKELKGKEIGDTSTV